MLSLQLYLERGLNHALNMGPNQPMVLNMGRHICTQLIYTALISFYFFKSQLRGWEPGPYETHTCQVHGFGQHLLVLNFVYE